MTDLPHDITGFILAGGRSRRMGTDKARIPWGTGTLLTHAVDRMRHVTARLFAVGSVESAPVAVLPDLFAGDGPLRGIQTALAQTATEWNLILAVDMPLVSASLLRFIAEQCEDGVSAVVPVTTRRDATRRTAESSDNVDRAEPLRVRQPLCAAYHRRLLPDFERALSDGEYSIDSLLQRLSTGIDDNESTAVRILDERELALAGFSADMFWNVNTPEDLDWARTLAANLNVY
ncbi:MAG: molybdenum cofactor guanylyltransferase [Terriglobales bacterium]|jgi:molybdenum cofactor guanylyltransferase